MKDENNIIFIDDFINCLIMFEVIDLLIVQVFRKFRIFKINDLFKEFLIVKFFLEYRGIFFLLFIDFDYVKD